ncbi:DUF2911 domain-containing protein [Flavobacterium arcticum]|uniref:DUF2911 domain-containing protein n=1 Tax=Flavobacterium arcticum TaxID=1784713 RepID=A0A345HDC5_9FLAO|nr:DUF2911 domain-containing protein [Flavobacterium arcticum]AXG74585.1 DUF2911 domain-containing protein [Flavobacterium arcticum]KAF2512295.1 DUF2911 domain-containing protein [Flavobacterium arcticum]
MKNLKKITLFITMLLLTGIASAQGKKASPAVTEKGTINDANITIEYSSPSVKGREIWGGLVPYSKIWRAGANDATTFTTDKAILIEGKKLPAGTYSFFVIPEKDSATIIFNKEAKQWGAYKYNEEKDQLRVKVTPKKSKKMNERLVYTINKNNITLSWENWDIPVMIK